MASRIITKKGSGAPLASDLVHGELAVDTVNKRLYTENAGGTIIEVGTAPSTIDINAGTIDGTVIGGSTAAAGTFTSLTASGDVNFDSNTLFVDASANAVGIGTSSPSSTLEVAGSSNSTYLKIGGDDTSNGRGLTFTSSASAVFNGAVHTINALSTQGVIAFATGSTERMRIDSSGNVGIGESDPSGYWSQADNLVLGGTGNDGITIKSTSVGNGRLVFTDTKSSTAGLNDGGMIAYSHDSDLMTFQTDGAERMRIDSSGNLLVGTTTNPTSAKLNVNATTSKTTGLIPYIATVASSSTCGILITSNSTAERFAVVFENGSGSQTVGSISLSGSSTSYNTSSDQRLKENITDAPAGNVDDIKVRSFDWKIDGSHQDYGMVAQELEAVAPYAVSKGQTEDDMWSVDYSKLVPMLIKEIQDLKAEVAALKGAN